LHTIQNSPFVDPLHLSNLEPDFTINQSALHMKHINSLFACMAILVALVSATPVLAASDQYKEEATQSVHQPQPETTAKDMNTTTTPVKEKKSPLSVLIPATPPAAAATSMMQRRRLDPPILLIIIGGGLWLLGLILIVVGAASLTTTGFGVAGIGWLMWVLGWLCASAGLIWWLVTR
jgi:hypothetical protein